MTRFPGGTRTKRPLTALALLAAAIAAVVNAAVVFACTGVMGPFLFNPTSGPAGIVVTTSASGLKPYPAKYDIFFGGSCMTFSGKLLKTIVTSPQGTWSNVTVRIPKTATLGAHPLCGVEAYPNPGSTATTHNEFTVT